MQRQACDPGLWSMFCGGHRFLKGSPVVSFCPVSPNIMKKGTLIIIQRLLGNLVLHEQLI